MTEREALSLAWSHLKQEGLQDAVFKVATTHFSSAKERKEILGDIESDKSDYWCISFLLKLDEGIVAQDPDSIVIEIDNLTSLAKIIHQM